MEAWLDVQSSVKRGWLLSRLRRKRMVARQNFSRCRCACALTALPSGLVYDPNMNNAVNREVFGVGFLACLRAGGNFLL